MGRQCATNKKKATCNIYWLQSNQVIKKLAEPLENRILAAKIQELFIIAPRVIKLPFLFKYNRSFTCKTKVRFSHYVLGCFLPRRITNRVNCRVQHLNITVKIHIQQFWIRLLYLRRSHEMHKSCRSLTTLIYKKIYIYIYI